MILEVIASGSGITLQDRGRVGWRRFGLPPGGAMDPSASAAANCLLANLHDAPVLECAQQGARFRVIEEGWLALAGADVCSQLRTGTAKHFRAGELIEFDRVSRGLYAYLAVSGGFLAETYFGSASFDPRIGLGQPVRVGMQLKAAHGMPNFTTEQVARRVLANQPNLQNKVDDSHFELLTGPQYDLFDPVAKAALVDQPWTVSKRSDRTGYRLEGPTLDVPTSIPSEPVLPGSFQIPGNGQPIVTMLDGPTVGGYAKIAVLKDADRPRFAQCAPGTQLSFSWKKSG